MSLNTDLLRKVREKITESPGEHYQAVWGRKNECGTTHCIAGWAAVLNGASVDWENDGDGWWEADTVNDGAESIERYAKEALGLTWEEANIFYASRDEALQRLDALIAEGRRSE